MEVGSNEIAKEEIYVVDLLTFSPPVFWANGEETAAHERDLKEIDKASGGKTVWQASI